MEQTVSISINKKVDGLFDFDLGVKQLRVEQKVESDEKRVAKKAT